MYDVIKEVYVNLYTFLGLDVYLLGTYLTNYNWASAWDFQQCGMCDQ